MNQFFKGKVIIITGSSMGIGKSLAILLGSYRSKLVINGRNADSLLLTHKELIDRGCEVYSFVGDITQEDDCENLIAETLSRYGRIDVLINNAGVSMRGLIGQLSSKVISSIFNVNAIGPLILTQMTLSHIKATKGSIIFISSLAALRGLPFISVYSAAKMSLTAIAGSLRAETKSDGIHIGLVYVGYTEIQSGKTAMGADGKPILLKERKGFFTSTAELVAKKIVLNISKRKSTTTIGLSGKLYAFLIKYFPGILEWLINRSHKNTDEYYR